MKVVVTIEVDGVQDDMDAAAKVGMALQLAYRGDLKWEFVRCREIPQDVKEEV
jgi:hypothetical protein